MNGCRVVEDQDRKPTEHLRHGPDDRHREDRSREGGRSETHDLGPRFSTYLDNSGN